MTVKQFLEQKYRSDLQAMTERRYKRLAEDAACTGKHLAEIMYMGYEITEFDIKANGGYGGELWQDIKRMHQAKQIASNQHRQYQGKVDAYWLTKKGFKALEVI